MEDELQKTLSHPCAQICGTNWIDRSEERRNSLELLASVTVLCKLLCAHFQFPSRLGYEEARTGLQYCPPLITTSSGRASIERVSKYIRDGYKK